MAPMERADLDTVELQIKETIQSLYQVLVQASAYDTNNGTGASSNNNTPNSSFSPQSSSSATAGGVGGAGAGRPSREVLAAELRTLQASLQAVHATSSTPTPEQALPHIPPELVQYVEKGRNPDIYTREFVELVRRQNQTMRGKQAAFTSFRDVLAGEMDKAMPELREDTARVVAATGGTPHRAV
ncbi:Mediator complex- subunit Med10 [Apiospora marii]|uniref:Mediator of RNA polymerase II transcription subunit 10 n=1 Tax=Apiospora marii TaxID=335849 RepID=A0ABR1S529_9PEZI